MSRIAFLVPVLFSLGCPNVQDLGATPPAPPRDSGTAPTPSSALVAVKVPPTQNAGACPSSSPDDGAACSADAGWCSYRIDPAHGLAAKCACGVDRRWTSLLVRDDDRRNPLPTESMPLTYASCTEGAPCAEGVRCTISGASPRTCSCTSAGILLCTRPAQ